MVRGGNKQLWGASERRSREEVVAFSGHYAHPARALVQHPLFSTDASCTSHLATFIALALNTAAYTTRVATRTPAAARVTYQYTCRTSNFLRGIKSRTLPLLPYNPLRQPRLFSSATSPQIFVKPAPRKMTMNHDLCEKAKVLVFGAGNFGSCLADHLADSEHSVFVWSRSPEIVKTLNETHRNPEYLKDHIFPADLHAVGPEFPSQELVRDMDVLLFAIPTEGVRYAFSAFTHTDVNLATLFGDV